LWQMVWWSFASCLLAIYSFTQFLSLFVRRSVIAFGIGAIAALMAASFMMTILIWYDLSSFWTFVPFSLGCLAATFFATGPWQSDVVTLRTRFAGAGWLGGAILFVGCAIAYHRVTQIPKVPAPLASQFASSVDMEGYSPNGELGVAAWRRAAEA